jgi:membrane protease YdiL (CAAX protease family)
MHKGFNCCHTKGEEYARVEDCLENDQNKRIILLYYVIATIILASAFLQSVPEVFFIYLPILLSILLLVPIYRWQKSFWENEDRPKEIADENRETALLRIVGLYALAMSVRIPSVLLFNQPYEKTPLIYLLVMVILVIEQVDLSAFGFRTENLRKSITYGVALFAIYGGLYLVVRYALVYSFTGQIVFQYYDMMSSVLVFPFMTLCVGISEEGLFRGYIQTHLERLYTPRLAILFQAILFGIWHFVWNLNPFKPIDMLLYVITTCIFGLVFGYFYSKSRNLVPLILAHGLWNSILVWMMESPEVQDYFSTFPFSSQLLVFVLPSIVSVTAAILFVKYFVKRV